MSIRTILRIGHLPTVQEILNLIATDQEWSVDCCGGDMDAFLVIDERHGVTWREEVPVGRNWRMGTGPLPAELIAEVIDLRTRFCRADHLVLVSTIEVQGSSTGRTVFRLGIRDHPQEDSHWIASWPEALDMLAMILDRHEVDWHWSGPSIYAGAEAPPPAAIADVLHFLSTVAE